MFEYINRKINFEYKIIEEFEAGVQLEGWEVKSLLKNNINDLSNSYIYNKDGELFWIGCEIVPLETTNNNFVSYDKKRSRKILIKKSKIEELSMDMAKKGYTLVVKRIYKNKKYIKLSICLVIGKNNLDKRNTIKEREQKIEINKILKNKNKKL